MLSYIVESAHIKGYSWEEGHSIYRVFLEGVRKFAVYCVQVFRLIGQKTFVFEIVDKKLTDVAGEILYLFCASGSIIFAP